MGSYYRDMREMRQSPTPKGGPTDWGAKCKICPLNKMKWVMGDGPKGGAKLTIIGEAPGREEEKVGIPFIGKSGALLENFLADFSVSRRDVWLDNAVACFPPGGDLDAFLKRKKKEHAVLNAALPPKDRKPFHHPRDCCRPRLMWALGVPFCDVCGKYEEGADRCVCPPKKQRLVHPMGRKRTVAAFYVGNVAMQSLLGVTGISERRGYVDDLSKQRGGTPSPLKGEK